jgi:hypothetical protein
MNHSPEPWKLTPGLYLLDINQDDVLVRSTEIQAQSNLLRIVTCVNACQGIDNDMVENIVQLGLREYKRLTVAPDDHTPVESSEKYLKPR